MRGVVGYMIVLFELCVFICMEHFKIYDVRGFYDRMLSTYVGVQTKHLSLFNITLSKRLGHMIGVYFSFNSGMSH
jgi:hypothetical protein